MLFSLLLLQPVCFEGCTTSAVQEAVDERSLGFKPPFNWQGRLLKNADTRQIF